MPLFRTEAIVIRSLPYGESDRIVTFFTSDFGKLKSIAKGARRSKKRFQNALGLFTYLRLIFFDREGMGLVRVESADILQGFPKIRESLKKIYYGNYGLELVNEISGEREANEEAFRLLLDFLFQLEKGEPKEEGLRIFEMKILSLFGYRPHLVRCGVCKRSWKDLEGEPHLFFSIEKGSLICPKCSKDQNNLFPLSIGTARLIDEISKLDFRAIQRLRFTPQALLESGMFLPKFIEHQLGKELKSLRALKGIH
ncbi:MAG: DNA repair protein RecO [Thermodesulfobacteriota bacterium]